MQGLFSDSEFSEINVTRSKKLICAHCGLHKSCITPSMSPTGEGRKGIYVLAEAPGEAEDRKGIQLIGKAGQRLRSALVEFDIDLDRDCVKDNAVRCRPEGNREPEAGEITSCRDLIVESIKEFQPKLILLLGSSAIKSFIEARWKKDLGGIMRWRGFVFPDRTYKCWVAPIFHPSYVMRSERKSPVVSKIFHDDLKHALSHLKKPLPTYKDEIECVDILHGAHLDEFLTAMLERAEREKYLIAFDYETTGLKPHAKGHKIVTCSICYDEDKSYAFSFPLPDKTLKLFKAVLAHPNIEKTAHNMKFEDTWSAVILNTKVQGWKWCSMQGTHLIDNRPKITGLKFQALVNFGLYDYDSSVSPYLEGVESKNANSLNRVHELDSKELCVYCGIDSLVQYKIALKQMARFPKLWSKDEGE